MSLTEVVVEGTLKPDGTLELDQTPNLPPGRVQVSVKPLPSALTPRPGLAGVIRQIQQDQQAQGFVGLSARIWPPNRKHARKRRTIMNSVGKTCGRKHSPAPRRGKVHES